ncbi:hypothetical protein SLEP1_g45900 [Rubroshorea leprosula]|uniref:Jacalin-type lectin domain-containing protein n=1 Tax=Rubroshorea leprosula TaxID=152421 RepID=A0AAV5LKI4_9ROSI|nr:hypothetical protein SLEP1_g45900 [Rubroshorea leprosula]
MADQKLIKVGAAGYFSCEDEFWDEKGNSELYEIYISYGDCVQSIQFQYVVNGKLVMSELHGICKGPKFNLIRLIYPSEFLTRISGDCLPNHKISSLKITTNKQCYGSFGRPTNAHHFDFQFGNSRQFGGFYGYCDKTRNNCLAALGVYFKPSSKLEIITGNCISVETEHTDDDSCACNDPCAGCRRKN